MRGVRQHVLKCCGAWFEVYLQFSFGLGDGRTDPPKAVPWEVPVDPAFAICGVTMPEPMTVLPLALKSLQVWRR
jgi:hypothetical protein